MKMTNENILKEITSIIHETFENDRLIVTSSTSADDVDEWDSMTHIQLISSIEKKYKIRFALGELQALKNVGEMVELIQKKLNK
jgi:acyl carrier protein